MSLRRSGRTPVQRVTYTSSIVETKPKSGGVKKKASTRITKTNASDVKPRTSKTKDREPQPATSNTRRALDKEAANGKGSVTPGSGTSKLTSNSYSTGDIDDATPPPLDGGTAIRPAQPHLTNALLRTPKGSRISAVTQVQGTSGPVHHAAEADTGAETTTENLLKVASAYLCKQDPRLQKIVDQHHCRIFSPEGLAEEIDPFRSLASGIMAQQVSGAAAKSIKNKFIGLFEDTKGNTPVFPTPEEVAKTDIPRLREAGLSQRKAEYIQGLAEKFANSELSAQVLANASDEEVLEKLVAVRGLGVWSVQMFMCFGLKRMDIFSTGDLGVQRGMAAYVGRDVAKLKAKGGGKWKYMSEQDMLDISAKFAPYRSLFMWLMWRVEDVDIDAIQDN